MSTSGSELNNKPKSKTTGVLRIILLVGFGIATILLAYLTFVAVRDFVSTWQITELPGVAVSSATTPEPGEENIVTNVDTPLQEVGGPTPPPWDGAKRVNLLVMGLDYHDWRAGQGPPRTDTMMLFTIDPINRTAGMLSIPRDLWVNIPGYNYGRINTAYQLGEAYKEIGGGPTVAIRTIEELLGVPVDFYAQIDFDAFTRFIDEIGGIKIDVPEKIKIDPITPGKNTNTIILRPGVQVLNGEYALAYARARKTDGGDFDRAQRQQQVVFGIRDRILKLNMLPTLFAKAGILYNELSKGVRTNLSLDQLLRLGWLASQIPTDQIKRGIIGPPDQVSFAVSPDGEQQVLKPITEKIRELRDEIFASGPISPIAGNLSPVELVQQEAARIAILNGSYTTGLAAQTADYLKTQGINVSEVGNAQQAVPATEITFYTGKPYTVKFLVDIMKINPLRVYYVNDPASPVDISITVGEDWVQKLPSTQ